MVLIKPRITDEVILICPFCKGEWELIMNETYNDVELNFVCRKCSKKINIKKLNET